MKKLYELLQKRFDVPFLGGTHVATPKEAAASFKYFTKRERTIAIVFAIVFILSVLYLFERLNTSFMVSLPTHGGSFIEGDLGTPRFINPLLAVSDPDRDLVSLVFSGLLRVGPDGKLIPDLAESYTISEDGRTYTFTLRENLSWHDGEELTSEDVAFTIHLLQNDLAKSPRRAHWEGVAVETPDARTIVFTLKQAYAPFLENTTLGILPKHLWQNVNIGELAFDARNLDPIGSGPYKLTKLKKDKDGIPIEATLSAFPHFALNEPYISTITIEFYANSEELASAYRNGSIDSVAAISPVSIDDLELKETDLKEVTLPRVFGLFFNQNEAAVFANIEVRKALNVAVDRERIVREVFLGYATPLLGPLSPGSLGYTSVQPAEIAELEKHTSEGVDASAARINLGRDILIRNGWKFNTTTNIFEKKKGKTTETLTFSISTGNAPELRRVAELLKEDWEKIGAKVDLKFFEIADLNQNVIRPRKYDALLFGQIVGRFSDPYAFWHSSQRLDPGLNVALYTSSAIDKTLEAARGETAEKLRDEELAKFQNDLVKDAPAVFLYAPAFLYAAPKEVSNLLLTGASASYERFSNIHSAYIYTENIWRIFSRKSN